MSGTCDPGFAGIAEALRENLATRGDLGAAVTVVVGGRTVADLWGGWADEERTRPWAPDTVVDVFSVGKALTALCVLRLVADGRLDLDAPVARHWPGFRAGDVTVRHVLAHRSGLAALRAPLPDGALYDWAAVTGALAATEPWWTPGATHGYHVHTFGFLAGELVRRVTGEPVGAMLAREIAGPVEADVWFGLPAAERARLSDYTFGDIGGGGEPAPASPAPAHDPSVPGELQELRHCAYMYPEGASGIGTVNTPAWLDAELPSANAHATARAVARVFAGLLDGRLLDAGILAEATAPASEGEDRVLGRPSRFGLGFQLTQPERPLGPNPRSFGHFGAGGAVGFADPDAGVAFGYVMNRGGPRWRNPRNQALIAAVYDALGA